MIQAKEIQSIKSDYFLGVRVDRINSEQAINMVERCIVNPIGESVMPVYFVNVHSIFLALQNGELLKQLNNACMTLADGSGLNWAGKMLATPIKENLNGTDLTPKILKKAELENWSVYLLGSKPHVIKKTSQILKKAYPHLDIKGSHHGYFDREDEVKLIEEINNYAPDMLLVGMGSPLQEDWIWRNRKVLNAKIAFAVGGLFDFMSGEFPRAPYWMRKLGLEWMYRFINDPSGKWKRIFVEIPLFLPLIFFGQFIPKKLSR